jgi:hypothetical protein
MSAHGDVRDLIDFHRKESGLHPKTVLIGHGVAEALAGELAGKQSERLAHVYPMKTKAEFLDLILSGEAYFMGALIVVESGLMPDSQADAIDGYRQVGPC